MQETAEAPTVAPPWRGTAKNWWPDQVDLKLLKSNDPTGGSDDYAADFLSLDLDAAAVTAAEANAAAASRVLRGRVRVVRADAFRTGLPPSSVDVAVADLPFGMAHARSAPLV